MNATDNDSIIYHFGDGNLLLKRAGIIMFEGGGRPPRVPPFSVTPTLDLGHNTWADPLGLAGTDSIHLRMQLEYLIVAHTDDNIMQLTKSLVGKDTDFRHYALVKLNEDAIQRVHPAAATAFLHLEVDQHGYGAMLDLEALPADLTASELHDRLITLVKQEQERRQ